MGIQNPDERLATALDAAMSSAMAALQSVGQSMKGAGPDSLAAYTALAKRTTDLPAIGSKIRSEIDRLSTDDSQPKEYRDRMAAQLHKAASDRLRDDYNALMRDALPKLESALGEASLPQPAKDAGERMLRRQELDRLLSGVTGAALAGKMTDLIGRNPSWDSELLSDHGRALLEAGGVGLDWPNFRKAAVGKLLSNPVGSERALANRKALSALYEKKLVGAVTGIYQLAKNRLGDPPREQPKPEFRP